MIWVIVAVSVLILSVCLGLTLYFIKLNRSLRDLVTNYLTTYKANSEQTNNYQQQIRSLKSKWKRRLVNNWLKQHFISLIHQQFQVDFNQQIRWYSGFDLSKIIVDYCKIYQFGPFVDKRLSNLDQIKISALVIKLNRHQEYEIYQTRDFFNCWFSHLANYQDQIYYVVHFSTPAWFKQLNRLWISYLEQLNSYYQSKYQSHRQLSFYKHFVFKMNPLVVAQLRVGEWQWKKING